MLHNREPLRRLLAPLLKRHRATLAQVMPIEPAVGSFVVIELGLSTRGRSVGDALTIGREAAALVEAAYATGPLRAETAAELLRTGHHRALLGQPEASWMEVKGESNGPDRAGHLHFVGDVTSFANASGGLIALGLKTQKRHGDDVITSAKGIRLDLFDVLGHRNLLRQWVYPSLPDVRIDAVAFSDDPELGIVVIEIPDQPAASKPFFVRRRPPASADSPI